MHRPAKLSFAHDGLSHPVPVSGVDRVKEHLGAPFLTSAEPALLTHAPRLDVDFPKSCQTSAHNIHTTLEFVSSFRSWQLEQEAEE